MHVCVFTFVCLYVCVHVCVCVIVCKCVCVCVCVCMGAKLDHELLSAFLSAAAYTSNFLGNGYIQYDLSQQAYQTTTDLLELRFKTNSPHGVLFYSSGNQGDFMVLQLNRGYLNFTIDLGQ